MARVMKARYFPNGSNLNACLGHNPSYTWRSMHSTRDFLKLGCRWRIRDGTMINLWGEPWICGPARCLLSPSMDHVNDLWVCDLMLLGIKTWNEPFIISLFMREVADLVLQVPQVEASQHDMMVWQPTKMGCIP